MLLRNGQRLLRVDNNIPPLANLNVSSLTQSDDKRRGIVALYTVRDAEGDTLDLVFQWTRGGQAFVELRDDEPLVQEILADPALHSAQPWRVRPPAWLALEAGVPRSATFLWDSRDLPSGQGKVLLRFTARDADASAFEHDDGKQILSGLAEQPFHLGGEGTTDVALSIAAADLDGDGGVDLISANGPVATLSVFYG